MTMIAETAEGGLAMRKGRLFASASFLVVFGLVLSSTIRAEERRDIAEIELSRVRATALMTALFHHDAENHPLSEEDHSEKTRTEGIRFTSLSPVQIGLSRERTKVVEFARSLVYEGGFYPKEIYQLLGYKDIKTARIARLTRQLDMVSGKKPAAWEVAGRVGRSGMTGASDHWAMAPAKDGADELSSPGTLAYLPALAIAYAAFPVDGKEAAAQLAILKDDDMRAASAARVAFSLLSRILLDKNHDKDAWLRMASADGGDLETERDIRAVRVKPWNFLRGEECAMGRLERAVYIWYQGGSYQEIMDSGRENLRSREALAYLAALAATTYGMESLPNRVIANGASDRQLLDLVADLHELATGQAVLRVMPEYPMESAQN